MVPRIMGNRVHWYPVIHPVTQIIRYIAGAKIFRGVYKTAKFTIYLEKPWKLLFPAINLAIWTRQEHLKAAKQYTSTSALMEWNVINVR